MSRLFERSLLLRLGIAMAGITTLAFIAMLSSVFIADTTQGDAGAVNEAGTLRMQSYRIATSLAEGPGTDPQAHWRRNDKLMQGFEQRLNSRRLVSVLPRQRNHVLSAAYQHVASEWHLRMKPLVQAYVTLERHHDNAQPITAPEKRTLLQLRKRYLAAVGGFVSDINRFVKLIEDDAESNIRTLRLIQVISLLFTVVVVFFAMYLVHTNMAVPLADLLTCAEGARRGDLSVRVSHVTDDELGRLGHAFNTMAEDLSKMYADLEGRVREKTISLERSNRSLELLYNTTKRLNEATFSDATYRALLEDIANSVGVGPGSICLSEEASKHAYRLATTRQIPAGVPDLCMPPKCKLCFGQGKTHELNVELNAAKPLNLISIPISEQDRHYGVLLFECPHGQTLEPWQVQLLEAVARHIAIALTLAQRRSEARRLALLEERSVMARELHDSLAQSLSYLKIQVSRLDTLLVHKDEGTAKARSVVDELRDGLNTAYRELRELLTTFRLRIDGRGLSAALEETIDDFRNRNGLAIELNNALPWGRLTPNEEIHVLQVIREALSNVARHAEANHARVTIDARQGEQVTVLIEDDGVGIPPEPARRNHYGLAIMEERAHSLKGTLHYAPRREGGTCVRLAFTPQRYSNCDNGEQGAPVS